MESISIAFSQYIKNNGANDSTKLLNLGQPSFELTNLEKGAIHESLDENKYIDPQGIYSLRKEINKKLRERNNIFCSEDDNILVTNGAAHALYLSLKLLLNKDDECVIIEPYWKQYELNVIQLGAKPVFVKMEFKNHFSLDIEKLIRAITPKTKVIILNFPNNPTGALLSKSELKKLLDYLKDKDIYIISDEVYEDYIFSDSDKVSVGAFSDTFDKVISIFSFSKSYSMTGYRIGYLVAAKEIINKLKRELTLNITCLSYAYQKGAESALKNHFFYQNKINRVIQNLRDLKEKSNDLLIGEHLIFPKSGFYFLIDINKSQHDSMSIAKDIFKSINVAVCPGIAFGTNFDGFLRVSATKEFNELFGIIKILNQNSRIWK